MLYGVGGLLKGKAMIRMAWCKELGGVFTAHEAKREYFALSPRPARLSFFCPDPACRAVSPTGGRVTCVNYRVLPEEEAVAVHYRVWDGHMPECRAFVPEAVGHGGDPAGARGAGGHRAGHRKWNDSFQVFDPGREGRPLMAWPVAAAGVDSDGDGDDVRLEGAAEVDDGSGVTGGEPEPRAWAVRGAGASSASRTGFVEDLVQLWEAAKRDPEVDALLDEQIAVVGVGRDKLRYLFLHVSRSAVGVGPYIWYGGARLKRYGLGFSLSFFDVTGDGRRLGTYVSSAEISDYRYRGMLLDVLERASERRYVTAYVWGWIGADPRDGEKVSLQPASLKHLCLVLGPRMDVMVGSDGGHEP